jgi:transcription elongation factor GreA
MSANEQILLTPAGKLELEEELRQLRQEKYPAVLARIQELSEAGDVSDDSDFEDSKEELIQLDARIRDIETTLDDAHVVDQVASDGTIRFGSTVTVVDDQGAEDTYVIVGPQEANPRNGRISNVSPVGSALVGKRVGDRVSIAAPGGQVELEITQIQ